MRIDFFYRSVFKEFLFCSVVMYVYFFQSILTSELTLASQDGIPSPKFFSIPLCEYSNADHVFCSTIVFFFILNNGFFCLFVGL